jgi:hypothetical protein
LTELVVGTKKGLFLLEGEPGSGFEIKARAFAGQPVDFATRDPRSGRLLATVTSPFYGPKIFYTDGDPDAEWEQADGVALPEGGDQALERIWVIACGEADGTLYAGGDPGSPVREPRRRSELGDQRRDCGSSRRARTGSRAAAGSACTRSAPGREIPTSWPSPSRPPGCG